MSEATNPTPSAGAPASAPERGGPPAGPEYSASSTSVFPPRGEIIATVCSWLAAIAAAALGFWLTEGASYHQLAIAVLSALISLAVVLALLDTLWRLLGHALGARARRRESPGSA